MAIIGIAAVLKFSTKAFAGAGTAEAGMSMNLASESVESLLTMTRASNPHARLYLSAVYGGASSSAAVGGPEDTAPAPLLILADDAMLAQNSPAASKPASAPHGQVRTYKVAQGDTVSSIAAKFGISTDTVLWANNLSSTSILRVGWSLTILPVSGLLHTVTSGETLGAIAMEYGADLQKVIDYNALDENGFIVDGQRLILPGGHRPVALSYRVASGIRGSARVNVGNYFIAPVKGIITQGLHAYNAVDIGMSCGVPIHAAAPGAVTLAEGFGWNGGYGEHVVLSHPNGTSTLYAHMSKVLVGVGENVSRGQAIGLVGTTGRSSGCHVHFEVRGAANPLAATGSGHNSNDARGA